jgi:hypothetical protein
VAVRAPSDRRGTEEKLKTALLSEALRARSKFRRGVQRWWERARRRAAAKRAPQEHPELATNIAARLTGLGPADFVFRVSVVSAKNRAFIRLHEVLPAACPESNTPLVRIVEKCSARPQEYQFYRLCADRAGAARRAPAPLLYHAIDIGFQLRNHLRYVIYFEHVERRALASRSPEIAQALARSLSALSTLDLPPGFQARNALRLSPDLLAKLISHVEAAGYTRHAATAKKLEEMVAGWPRILAVRQLNLPSVPSHNDLHVHNVRLRSDCAGEPEVVFIDWEAFGWNYVGADLHHFVRETVVQPELTPFFEALRSRYVERVRKNYSIGRLQVDIGAYAYALTRAISRVIRKGDRRELHVVFRLYARVAGLLAKA